MHKELLFSDTIMIKVWKWAQQKFLVAVMMSDLLRNASSFIGQNDDVLDIDKCTLIVLKEWTLEFFDIQANAYKFKRAS